MHRDTKNIFYSIFIARHEGKHGQPLRRASSPDSRSTIKCLFIFFYSLSEGIKWKEKNILVGLEGGLNNLHSIFRILNYENRERKDYFIRKAFIILCRIPGIQKRSKIELCHLKEKHKGLRERYSKFWHFENC